MTYLCTKPRVVQGCSVTGLVEDDWPSRLTLVGLGVSADTARSGYSLPWHHSLAIATIPLLMASGRWSQASTKAASSGRPLQGSSKLASKPQREHVVSDWYIRRYGFWRSDCRSGCCGVECRRPPQFGSSSEESSYIAAAWIPFTSAGSPSCLVNSLIRQASDQ